MKKKYSLLISVVISLSILLIFLIIQNSRPKKQISKLESPKSKITLLPKFSTIDIFGNLITSSDLKGKYVYIQFVNPAIPDEIELTKKVCVEYKNHKDLIIIVFTKGLEIFDNSLPLLPSDIIVIKDDYEKLKSIFKVPPCCESFYIFDRFGKVVTANLNTSSYDEAVKPYLTQLINKRRFAVSHFARPGDNILNIGCFEQIRSIILDGNYEYYIISMFVDVCMNCRSGWIINTLKKLYALNNRTYFFLSILSKRFNENDVNNLKNQMGIMFKVIIADEKLGYQWKELINEYRESDLTNLLFLVNKNGQIIKSVQPSCKCEQEFFSFLRSKMEGMN